MSLAPPTKLLTPQQQFAVLIATLDAYVVKRLNRCFNNITAVTKKSELLAAANLLGGQAGKLVQLFEAAFRWNRLQGGTASTFYAGFSDATVREAFCRSFLESYAKRIPRRLARYGLRHLLVPWYMSTGLSKEAAISAAKKDTEFSDLSPGLPPDQHVRRKLKRKEVGAILLRLQHFDWKNDLQRVVVTILVYCLAINGSRCVHPTAARISELWIAERKLIGAKVVTPSTNKKKKRGLLLLTSLDGLLEELKRVHPLWHPKSLVLPHWDSTAENIIALTDTDVKGILQRLGRGIVPYDLGIRNFRRFKSVSIVCDGGTRAQLQVMLRHKSGSEVTNRYIILDPSDILDISASIDERPTMDRCHCGFRQPVGKSHCQACNTRIRPEDGDGLDGDAAAFEALARFLRRGEGV